MRILVIADPKIPVPPKEYGGAERIAAMLAREFERRGHVADLLAGPGSQSFGGKLIIHRMPSRARASRAWRKIIFQFLSLRSAWKADAVVNFGRLDYLEAILRTSKPVVCSFQNPVAQAEIDWLLTRRRKNIALVGVSAFQLEGLRPRQLFCVIHNATDIERLHFCDKPDHPPYLAFLGRITANKGADTAIEVARRSGLKLKLAGTVSDEPGGREFFEQIIKPQLNNGIEHVGPVNDEQKQALLGGAQALLFPIRWHEPCAVTVTEALACGTPIIAARCASTPEVVQHGKTGFLCDDVEQMVASVAQVNQIDRAICRAEAAARFSTRVLAEKYLAEIARLLRQRGPMEALHN